MNTHKQAHTYSKHMNRTGRNVQEQNVNELFETKMTCCTGIHHNNVHMLCQSTHNFQFGVLFCVTPAAISSQHHTHYFLLFVCISLFIPRWISLAVGVWAYLSCERICAHKHNKDNQEKSNIFYLTHNPMIYEPPPRKTWSAWTPFGDLNFYFVFTVRAGHNLNTAAIRFRHNELLLHTGRGDTAEITIVI